MEYLAQFADEYIAAAIHKTKAGKVKAGHLHTKDEHVKAIYDANNRRNNDVYGVSRANNLLYDINSQVDSDDGWYITKGDLTEEALISQIDSTREVDSITLMEYVESREYFAEDRKVALDAEVCGRYGITRDFLYTIITAFSFKIISRRWILTANIAKLKQFIQNANLIQE